MRVRRFQRTAWRRLGPAQPAPPASTRPPQITGRPVASRSPHAPLDSAFRRPASLPNNRAVRARRTRTKTAPVTASKHARHKQRATKDRKYPPTPAWPPARAQTVLATRTETPMGTEKPRVLINPRVVPERSCRQTLYKSSARAPIAMPARIKIRHLIATRRARHGQPAHSVQRAKRRPPT